MDATLHHLSDTKGETNKKTDFGSILADYGSILNFLFALGKRDNSWYFHHVFGIYKCFFAL